MTMFSKIPVKVLVIACILMQSVVIMGFALSSGTYWVMCVCRFFTGTFQIFISIYAPIWIDTYAPNDSKAKWMTLLTVATPGGMVTGYLLTAVILSCGASWQISFFIQIVALFPILITIISIDSKFLRIKSSRRMAESDTDVNDEDSEDF